MKGAQRLLILVFGAVAPAIAYSQSDGNMDGNTLYSICTSSDENLEAVCLAYFIGYREGRKWGS